MTQQEVMELMQRYLDKDLSDKESAQLLEHLENDLENRELFDRMQKLSDDLANLPKVSPPFSIVDSILPQLQQLDIEQLEMDHSQTEAPKSWKQRLRTFLSTYRMASGAIAAGVVLVILLMNGNLQDMLPSSKHSVSDSQHMESVSLFTAEASNAPPSAKQFSSEGDTAGEVEPRSLTANNMARQIDNGDINIAEWTEMDPLASPNEHYFAQVHAQDDTTVLIVTDQHANEIVVIEFAKGSHIQLRTWSEDSSILTYELSSAEQSEIIELHMEPYLSE